jgi:hypothetical protein
MGQVRYAAGTESSSRGSFPMETASSRKYEEFAAECERLAKDARSEHHRAVLREMAEAWRKLAEAAAKRG